MHTALIHIGTEKTGSTSIQNLFYQNHKPLQEAGILFPFEQCGYISNFRLVLFTQSSMDPALMRMARELRKVDAGDAAALRRWRKSFHKGHVKAVRAFQKSRKRSTVFYSSEHFHSRIRSVEDIQALATGLRGLFDEIKIVAYVRRQDRLACSAWNTAVQGGATHPLDLAAIGPGAFYYDYLAMVKRWADAFGRDAMDVRLFDKDHLAGGDVVEDFRQKLLLPEALPATGTLQTRHSNPRLSSSALAMLKVFNGLSAGDPVLQGCSMNKIRQPLINRLHDVEDAHGEMLPARSEVEQFLAGYADDNEELSRDWLGSLSFSDDLSMYPEHTGLQPDGDFRAALEAALQDVIPGISRTAA